MNYDLIELAKRCPDLAITVRLADLVMKIHCTTAKEWLYISPLEVRYVRN